MMTNSGILAKIYAKGSHMCDFSTLTNEEKKQYHEKLLNCAENFGGKNFFLKLLEAIRESKLHPLIAANSEFTMEHGTIKWNKVIFNDKLQQLLKARINESEQENLLPDKGAKNHKKVLNVVRTLKPIVFHVRPAIRENGSGFFFQPFDVIDENTTRLNSVFDALFFCSIASVKKALEYTP